MTIAEMSQWNDVAITLVGAAAFVMFYLVGKHSAKEREKELEAERRAASSAAGSRQKR